MSLASHYYHVILLPSPPRVNVRFFGEPYIFEVGAILMEGFRETWGRMRCAVLKCPLLAYRFD